MSVDHCYQPAIHQASPIVTAANTVIVPVRTGCSNTYQLQGRRGSDGALLWSHPTNYTGAVFSPALTAENRLYFPGAGGAVFYMDNPDMPVLRFRVDSPFTESRTTSPVSTPRCSSTRRSPSTVRERFTLVLLPSANRR